jgi:dolichol kinase
MLGPVGGLSGLFFWLVVIAIIFTLVRPASRAGQALVALTDAIAGIIGAATGARQTGS